MFTPAAAAADYATRLLIRATPPFIICRCHDARYATPPCCRSINTEGMAAAMMAV